MVGYPVAPAGCDARVWSQHPLQPGPLVRPIGRKPQNGSPCDDMDDRPSLVEQRRVLDRALTATDDDDSPPLEGTQIMMLAGMRDESTRQSTVRFRSSRIVVEADRHDDGCALYLAAVFERQEKGIPLTLD